MDQHTYNTQVMLLNAAAPIITTCMHQKSTVANMAKFPLQFPIDIRTYTDTYCILSLTLPSFMNRCHITCNAEVVASGYIEQSVTEDRGVTDVTGTVSCFLFSTLESMVSIPAITIVPTTPRK